MLGRIGVLDDQRSQLSHLCRAQSRRAAGADMGLKAIDPGRVVTMDPVPQRLPNHAVVRSRFAARPPFQNQGQRQSLRTCAPSGHLLAKDRSSQGVLSNRVTVRGAPIRSHAIKLNLSAGWYYNKPRNRRAVDQSTCSASLLLGLSSANFIISIVGSNLRYARRVMDALHRV